MKRHSALQGFSREHHEVLILAQLLRKDAPQYKGLPTDVPGKQAYALGFWEEKLKVHVQLEEQVLFPMISGQNETIDELILVLKDDHCEMEEAFKRLLYEVQVLRVMDELSQLLIRHVRMEERELFQIVQEVASRELLFSIEARLEESVKPPHN